VRFKKNRLRIIPAAGFLRAITEETIGKKPFSGQSVMLP